MRGNGLEASGEILAAVTFERPKSSAVGGGGGGSGRGEEPATSSAGNFAFCVSLAATASVYAVRPARSRCSQHSPEGFHSTRTLGSSYTSSAGANFGGMLVLVVLSHRALQGGLGS